MTSSDSTMEIHRWTARWKTPQLIITKPTKGLMKGTTILAMLLWKTKKVENIMPQAVALKITSNSCLNKRNLRSRRKESPKSPQSSSWSQQYATKTWREHMAEWQKEKLEDRVLSTTRNDSQTVKSLESRLRMNLEYAPS